MSSLGLSATSMSGSAGVAQTVEQLTRNEQVVGSSPIPGSSSLFTVSFSEESMRLGRVRPALASLGIFLAMQLVAVMPAWATEAGSFEAPDVVTDISTQHKWHSWIAPVMAFSALAVLVLLALWYLAKVYLGWSARR